MKFDVDSVFRRLLLAFDSMIKKIFTLGTMAYLSLRLLFGATSSSNFWSVISEPMEDVMNHSMNHNILPNLALKSHHFDSHYQDPRLLPSNIPFRPSFLLISSILPPSTQFINVYVEDFICTCLDKKVSSIPESRICYNIITNVFSLFFSHNTNQLPNGLLRSVALLIRKLSGDGTPSKIKKILGWIIDTRRMLISLPIEKYKTWKKEIEAILVNGSCSPKTLECIIGKLVRISRIIPGSQCFLKPILTSFYSSTSTTIKLTKNVLDDLKFWL